MEELLLLEKHWITKDSQKIPIMSYAVKYSSGYYGPFRDAADSAPAFGDRRSHQMDIANGLMKQCGKLNQILKKVLILLWLNQLEHILILL